MLILINMCLIQFLINMGLIHVLINMGLIRVLINMGLISASTSITQLVYFEASVNELIWLELVGYEQVKIYHFGLQTNQSFKQIGLRTHPVKKNRTTTTLGYKMSCCKCTVDKLKKKHHHML